LIHERFATRGQHFRLTHLRALLLLLLVVVLAWCSISCILTVLLLGQLGIELMDKT
jgi:hypothetical protein